MESILWFSIIHIYGKVDLIMIFYYIFWFFVSFLALPINFGKFRGIIVLCLFLILTLFSGLRFEIGVDWDNYLRKYENYKYITNLKDFLALSEPGYGLLNFISQNMGLNDLILVNLVCATLFYSCFYKFSNYFKNIFFPLFVCFVYTIVVVSNNYTRQIVSIGFSFLVILCILRKEVKWYIFYIFLGMLFHTSIIIFMIFFPFVLNKIDFSRKVFLYFYSVFCILFFTLALYLSSILDASQYTDSSSDMTSGGVYMRLLMHVLPIILYIYNRNKFTTQYPKFYMVLDLSVMIISYMFILAFGYSTLIDRFNLYFVFFDIFVLSFLYSKFNLDARIMLWLSIFMSNTMVYFVWLNYGKWTAISWIPYNNYIYMWLKSVF